MTEKPLYSTATGRQEKEISKKSPCYRRGEGPAKMRLETRGRAGKCVTVVFNIPVDEEAAGLLAKEMKSQFGCGGTIKESVIELAGDMRDKVEAFFIKRSFPIKRVGG